MPQKPQKPIFLRAIPSSDNSIEASQGNLHTHNAIAMAQQQAQQAQQRQNQHKSQQNDGKK